MKCIIKNYNGLKNIICAIILMAAVSCSEGNISMIDEFPVEKDLVGIPVQHDMLGVVDIKAIDTLLVAAVMDGRDGFWKFCRLQDMSVVYSCFREGNGPYEYVSAPWLYNQQFISGNGNSQCMIYDFTRGGIKVLDIGRTLSTKTTAAQDSDYKLPGGLFGWRYLGDGTFIIKEVDERHTREERYLLSGSDMKKIDIEGLNDLAVAAGNDINIIGTTIGSNGDGSIVAEACTHLNNLYLYAPDGSSFKTICIGPHGYDDPAAVQERVKTSAVKTFYEGLECFPDFFCALYTNDTTDRPSEQISSSSVLFFDWDGTPLARVHLDRYVTSVTVCRNNGTLYAVNYNT